MHMVLALTQIHETALGSAKSQDGVRNSHHWDQATSLLRTQLSQPVASSERDALWIAVALHSVAYLAATEASIPAEAWPLRPSSCLDLAWLKLCNGKQLVADLTDPLRDDSAFCLAAGELQTMVDYLKQIASRPPRLESLPKGFYELFELSGDPKGNPYFASVAALAHILSLDLDAKNFTPHLCWTCVLDKELRYLLHEKDERAMLLLVYWYAKICDRRIWWMWKQSWTEGLAICSFLEAAWTKQPNKTGLLNWPKEALTKAANNSCRA